MATNEVGTLGVNIFASNVDETIGVKVIIFM